MPTTYAHNLFGKAVFQKLPEELKNIVLENSMSYQIGLHGPDVLFYYKLFSKNPVNALASSFHKAPAAEIFRRCKNLLNEDGEPALLAYTLGFICHFMLDSTCHPFIREYEKKTGAGHSEIETDFDRFLMETTEKNPFTYRPGSFIRLDGATLQVMEKVLEPATGKELRKALTAMRFYTGVIVRPTAAGRFCLQRGMKLFGIPQEMQGHIMRRRRSARCRESTGMLLELFHLAVPETVTVIDDFYRTLRDEEYLNGRFQRNFE